MNQQSLNDYGTSRSTRDEAYVEVVSSGVAETQLRQLFKILVEVWPESRSNNELARLTGLRINAVTARMIELRRLELGPGIFLIEGAEPKRDDVTHVLNAQWRVNPFYFSPSRRVVNDGAGTVCP